MKKYHDYSGADVTLVICAYKECLYLEDCIKSVVNQSEKTKVLISTSTYNEHIEKLAKKYDIVVKTNLESGQIKDYNFAISQVRTRIFTLVHQDDLLHKDYVRECLKKINHAKNPILACTNYMEMHNDLIDKAPTKIVVIKRLLIWPLRIPILRATVVGKWLAQCIGNPITHPTVMCVKNKMPVICFRESQKATMDWDLWQRLIFCKGAFVYNGKNLLYHRMNKDNISTIFLKDSNIRYNEELEILCRFWPRQIAKFIMKFYSQTKNFY